MKKLFVAGLVVLSVMAGNQGYAVNETENSQEAVFGRAKWIGAPADKIHFMPERLMVFSLGFDLLMDNKSSASFIYGADDPRLMSPNLNIYNLENKKGESYVRIDFQPDGTTNLYRSGYSPNDNPSEPVASFKTDVLKTDGSPNQIEIRSNYGHTDILVNGRKAGFFGLNPIGNGGDYIAFPALCAFGAEIPTDSHAEICDVTVRNFREPGNILFRRPGDAPTGSFIKVPAIAMPELRTSFTVNPEKTVNKAEITVTARGIYDMTLNGKRVTDDYFNPAYTQYNKTHTYRVVDLTPVLRPGNITGSMETRTS